MNTIKRNPSIRIILPGIAALLFLASPDAVSAADAVSGAFQRSYTLEARGKYGNALAAMEQVGSSQQQSYIYQLRVGWLRYLSGKHRQAAQAYQAAARLAPLAVEPLQGLMLPQMATRRWKDALGTAERILRMVPGNYLASTRKAWVLFNLGRYRQAEQVYVSVLRRYPANLTLRAGLGWARARQGRHADAARVFRAVLRYSAKNSSAVQGLKWLRKQQRGK